MDANAAEPNDVADVCVVVPSYNEEPNLDAFYIEVSAALAELGVTYKYLFVDDGSSDNTQAILGRLRSIDSRVTFVRLSRNFGLQSALAAGLQCADSRAVVVMDADLQDDPAALRKFVDEWRAGADVVYAIREKRKENFVRRFLTAGFYSLMDLLADIPIPRQAGTFALYDRCVVNQINALPETNRYLPGLRAWVGFRQVGITVERRGRHAGKRGQSAVRLLSLALDGLLSFSKAPLRLASLLGFGVTGLAVIGFLTVSYWRFVQGSFPAGVGQAVIALSLLFLGGVQLLVLGILGEYLGRMYQEVKHRPHFVISESHGVSGARTE